MPHGKFDPNLDKLIKQQTEFIGGTSPVQVGGGPSPLGGGFRSTLNEMLQGTSSPIDFGTGPSVSNNFQNVLNQAIGSGGRRGGGGFRADTSAARGFAEEASQLTLQDTLAAIQEQMAAKGLTGSSAQSQQGITAGVDLATLLGERLASLELGADEAAAGRRLEALGISLDASLGGRGLDIEQARIQSAADDAASGRRLDALGISLGEAAAADRTRGLDLEQAGLDLSGRTQQAGAGQDLINALLRNNPALKHPDPPSVSSPLFTRNQLAPPRASSRASLPAASASGPGGNFMDLLVNARLRERQPLGGVGMLGAQRDLQILNDSSMFRNEDLASIFGQAGGAQVASAGAGALGNLFSTMQGSAGQLQNTDMQQRFLNNLIAFFGTQAAGVQ